MAEFKINYGKHEGVLNVFAKNISLVAIDEELEMYSHIRDMLLKLDEKGKLNPNLQVRVQF